MFLKKFSSPGLLAALTTAILFGLLNWGDAQAFSLMAVDKDVLQQTMPVTSTMPGPDMMVGMPMRQQEAMTGTMTIQPRMMQGGMGQMMAHMARMQAMMARIQRMMAGGMMGSSAPMTGTMPMTGMMQGDMGEMMAMMAEMQEMMAEMQGMMAGEIMASDMPMGGQMQGQQVQGGMMGQMPMMGTMILIAPMPMSGMMQQMPGMGMTPGMNMGDMMGQMPMMQGMGMGGMMEQGASQAAAPASPSTPAQRFAAQIGKLGAIDVKVTPPDLSNIQGDMIDFTVDLNATGADLSFNLAEMATLRIVGHAVPATAWEVVYDHGHHVNGVLKFPAHMSGPVESATLTITDPEGGESLELTWTPAR
ncbi:MAG TPA: hypothetical protein DCL15_05175 [Chloroflexi bacterium]|nr:hypothetical protein [Chloroflexota bacterium]HHW85322.1 hypothetical protein [Chloroflexota bacterium]